MSLLSVIVVIGRLEIQVMVALSRTFQSSVIPYLSVIDSEKATKANPLSTWVKVDGKTTRQWNIRR